MFIERLAAWRKRDEARLRKWLSACRDHLRRQAKQWIVSDQRDLARLHEKFATIFAAGALAIKLGILPWSYRELASALLKYERAHVELAAQASPNRRKARCSTATSALRSGEQSERRSRASDSDPRTGLLAGIDLRTRAPAPRSMPNHREYDSVNAR